MSSIVKYLMDNITRNQTNKQKKTSNMFDEVDTAQRIHTRIQTLLILLWFSWQQQQQHHPVVNDNS